MNILLIIAGLLLVWKIVDGYKKGMVREIVSLVSVVVLGAILILIVNALHSYVRGELASVVLMIVLLCILGVAHHLLGVVFFSAKVISKLPVLHTADKLLGVVVGALETVCILWVVYFLTRVLDLGMIGQQLLQYTESSSILLWIYEHNYLAQWMEKLFSIF